MFDYAALRDDAHALIVEFGASATLKRKTEGAYNPATASAAITSTTQTVQAVVFDYPQKYIDGTLILQGDKQAYISARGISAPRAGDALAWGGKDMQIVSVKPLEPALVAVLYEAQIRG